MAEVELPNAEENRPKIWGCPPHTFDHMEEERGTARFSDNGKPK